MLLGLAATMAGIHGSSRQRAERRAETALDRPNLMRIMPTQGV